MRAQSRVDGNSAMTLDGAPDLMRRCRFITERSLQPTAATDGPEHIIRYANPAFCRLAARNEKDLVGRPFAEIIQEGKTNRGVSLLDEVYRTAESGAAADLVHRSADGKTMYWSYAAWTLLDDERGPAGVMVQVTDATETVLARQFAEKTIDEIRDINQQIVIAGVREHELARTAADAEEMKLQSQKMEAIGRLAGGIAHDFNNILTVILGFTELAETTNLAGDKTQRYLHTIKTAAERAATLTSQLLAFAHKQVIEPKVVNLNVLILDVEVMLRRLIGEDLELTFLTGADLGTVEIDPVQFEQVLINLVVNARDAMPGGGTITIETGNATLDEEYARLHPDVTLGAYVLLSVSDTGAGISEEVLPHLFEPFFTTKDQGKGTGLGLATCYGIVQQSGGHIWVHSEPGAGTTFKIYLPRTEAAAPIERQLTSLALPRGTEAVILVEDEPLVREIGVSELRHLGYSVFEAANGVDALRLMDEYPGEIDLLVTDLVMPQMGGRELAERLCAIRPNTKVLFTSGYMDDAVIRARVFDSDVAFLQKPFTPAALAYKVREVCLAV